MNHNKIEKKHRENWKKNDLYHFDSAAAKNKFYLLEMFSYPSSSNLHLGHWWNYGLSDSYGRFKRMQEYDVFQPMGYDAFGLPAENFALKTGIHPKDSTYKNMDIMDEQLQTMGATFNWNYKLATCEPSYYKWTQWLFLQLYKNGLAYQKYSPVNWCPSCKTVLANEQVIGGECDRCKSLVERKDMTQWFFKITDYAEELLNDLNKIDWPQKTKIAQTNWIGKSIGAEIIFKTDSEDIKVFTSRPDTLYGVTYVVLAPENKLVKEFTTPQQAKAVEDYINESKLKQDIDRLSTLNKSGVFTGSYCINPINNKKIPIFIADYVLNTYATGCVMGVPAHDERDFDFATLYNLPIIQVITSKSQDASLPYINSGIMINSDDLNGMDNTKAKDIIVNRLEEIKAGNKKINYRLRDWSVSRQRYWGAPIPIIHCKHCGIVPVPEKDLPVELPYDVDWKPDGKSPLGKNEDYMSCICPKCGKPARRDPDTLDTFVCSSWYYLRYPDANNTKEPFNKDVINKMLPVDKYVGGIEHATMHLLYARFITKFLRDQGFINFDEPFKSLIHQGMILGADGQKMSKSKGNTVSPDEFIKEYGSDALRLHLMFTYNYLEGGNWSSENLKNMTKFMDRIERIVELAMSSNGDAFNTKEDEALEFVFNNSIKNITKDLEIFSFNTCLARIMELVNQMYKYELLTEKNSKLYKKIAVDLVKILAPFAPHFAEEIWQEKLGFSTSIFNEKYPVADEKKLIQSTVEILIQIKSKPLTKMIVENNLEESKAKELILNDEKVKQSITGKNILKFVYIKNRLCNIITD